jgi:tRNA (mo5U34)-methyltransferase
MMTKEELQAKVDSMVFYHRIVLPHGIVTPGIFPLYPEHYKLPADLTGKSVLDVGAWDGYWTFECLKRGAANVTAIDDFSDTIHAGEKRSWAQFDLCRQALGYANVDRDEVSVYDVFLPLLPAWPVDVVLFLGTLYHLKHPMLALDRLRAVCAPNALLIVESHICDDYSPYEGGMGHGHGEKMVCEFYPGKQLGGCQTNWWAPTLKCLANMVEAAGFKDVRAWKIDAPDQLPFCRGFVQAIAG